ncbi:MAG: molybdopterin-dependent oxidoreductase [Bacteroides sp.]|nr:molybdopterin-dependent oxidoreductase [Prevotella sp.]MCM1407238.1 molybdopterin-dependent oxidoreductase [Treponema brennaborense]MCM1469726.1 molybdopterin-dependent oxidoreductase [Bacteroides sp.]
MPSKSAKTEKETSSHLSKTFYSDLYQTGMLHAVLVRSPVACGELRSLTLPGIPDNCRLITAKDVPGLNKIKIRSTEIPILAEKNIAYGGEPIGILTGPDIIMLRELSEKIVMKFSADTNTQEPKKKIHRILEYGTKPIEQDSETEKEIKKDTDDFTVLNQSYRPHLDFPSYNEPCGAFVFFQNSAKDEKSLLTVYSPTQWTSNLRSALAAVCEIDETNIHIKQTVSNSRKTNSIWANFILAAQAAIASICTGKPVKLMLPRFEQERFIETQPTVDIRYKSLLRRNGRIASLDISITMQTGAFNPFIEEQLNRLCIAAAGIYKPEHMRIETISEQTRDPPSSLPMLPGDSHAFFAIENFMQEAALLLKNDPILIRQINSTQVLTQDDASYPFDFNNKYFDSVIEDVLQRSDFKRKNAVYALNAAGSRTAAAYPFSVRGIGFAAGFEGGGFFLLPSDALALSLEVTLETDNTVSIHSYLPSESIQSIWKRTAAEYFDIKPEEVSFDTTFSEKTEPLLSSAENDDISIMTQLLKKCCAAIQRQRFREPLPITVKRSAKTAKNGWNAETFSGIPFHSTAAAAAVIETEIDPITYANRIKGIWLTIDSGAILDIKQAKMAVKKNVQNILSCIRESNPADTADIYLSFINTNEDPKQIGNAACNVIPAAYTASLHNALNTSVVSLPITPKKIFAAFMSGNDSTEQSSNINRNEI